MHAYIEMRIQKYMHTQIHACMHNIGLRCLHVGTHVRTCKSIHHHTYAFKHTYRKHICIVHGCIPILYVQTYAVYTIGPTRLGYTSILHVIKRLHTVIHNFTHPGIHLSLSYYPVLNCVVWCVDAHPFHLHQL